MKMWEALHCVYVQQQAGTQFNAYVLFNIRKEPDEMLQSLIAQVTTAMQSCQKLQGDLLEANDGVLSLMAVMSEGLGFNLCVAPFLNVCVPNLPQVVKDRECRRWLEFGSEVSY